MGIKLKDLNLGDEFFYDFNPKNNEKLYTAKVRVKSFVSRSVKVTVISDIYDCLTGVSIGQEFVIGISDRCFVKSKSGFCFRLSETETLNPADRKY